MYSTSVCCFVLLITYFSCSSLLPFTNSTDENGEQRDINSLISKLESKLFFLIAII